MSEYDIRLDFLCSLKNVSFKTAQRVIALRRKYNTWELAAYVVNPPSRTVIQKVKKIVEDLESSDI